MMIYWGEEAIVDTVLPALYLRVDAFEGYVRLWSERGAARAAVALAPRPGGFPLRTFSPSPRRGWRLAAGGRPYDRWVSALRQRPFDVKVLPARGREMTVVRIQLLTAAMREMAEGVWWLKRPAQPVRFLRNGEDNRRYEGAVVDFAHPTHRWGVEGDRWILTRA